MAAATLSSLYYIDEQGMSFNVTYTLRASRVERRIREVKEKFLDATPIKFVGLDCEFTNAVKNTTQADLPFEKRRRAAVLQLSVAQETLVFQIFHGDVVPEALREFLNDDSIVFRGSDIGNDIDKLDYYGIDIPAAIDLLQEIQNPTAKPLASLYNMTNAYIGTNLPKKDPKISALRWDGFFLKCGKITPASASKGCTRLFLLDYS
jgi:hypothetical protein